MLLGWVFCLLVALTQAQFGPLNELSSENILSAVEKKLSSLANKPLLLSGGSSDAKTLKEARSVATAAKKLLTKTHKKLTTHIGEASARDGGKLQVIVEKLSALSKKVKADNLNNEDKKLLNHMVSEGLQSEATKALGALHTKITTTLSKEQAPAAAKLLLSQVMTQQLTDVTKKQVKKMASTQQIDQGVDDMAAGGVADEVGVNDDIGVGDEVGVNDAVGVSDAEGVNDNVGVSDGEGVNDNVGISDAEGVNDNVGVGDAVSDDAPVADEGVAGEENHELSAPATGGGRQKKLCIFMSSREYCVTQEKAV